MTMASNGTIILVVLILMCACAPSTASKLPAIDRQSQFRAELDETNFRIAALANRLIDLPPTDPDLIPTTGEVGYSGFWAARLENKNDLVTDQATGQLEMRLSFLPDLSVIKGSIHSFRNSHGTPMQGDIGLSNIKIDRETSSSNTITFSGSGSLEDTDGNVLEIDATFEGNFLGRDVEAIVGKAAGHATVDNQTQAIGGAFIAER